MDDALLGETTAQQIVSMKAALGAGGSAGSVWVVNDLAGEGKNHVLSSKIKALAVPVDEPSCRVIFGGEDLEDGAPMAVTGVGGKVRVGDKVFLLIIGDCGCVSDVLRVFKELAAAEAGRARIQALAEAGGWCAWTEAHTIV